MNDVTDELAARRKARDRKRDYGAPHLTLHLWYDPKDGEIVCSQLEGLAECQPYTGREKDETTKRILLAASRTGAMLAEEPGADSWMAEPVMVGMVTRHGFLMSRPHRFWHDEAGATPWKRLRCACWAARQGWRVMKPLWQWCWLLAFRPRRLRELEVE